MGLPSVVRDYCEAATSFVAKRGPRISELVVTTVTGWHWDNMEKIARAPYTCHTYHAHTPKWTNALLPTEDATSARSWKMTPGSHKTKHQISSTIHLCLLKIYCVVVDVACKFLNPPSKAHHLRAKTRAPQALGAAQQCPTPARCLRDELRALLQSQQEAIRHLQARLEGLAMAERNAVRDLNVAVVEQFLAGERVASWMQQSREALCDYLHSSDTAPVRPSDVMGKAIECPRGDRLAYRLWRIILDSRHTYAQHYVSDDSSRADPANPLDALSWSEAVQRGSPSFKYKGIDFAMRQGVLHWMLKKGRWIPVSARPSGDCQRCDTKNVPQEQLRHWHFQCPHWS